MYSPPASGFIAPSSAYVIAPKMESNPPTIHARYTSLAEPAACIISAGTRKMPLPMMVPMTIAVPCHTLSSRGSSRRALVMSNSRGEKACGVSDGKGHNGSKSNVPGPRDAYAKQIVGCVGRKPQKNIHQESAGHPDECAACIRTFGQDAEQKNSEHGTVGDGSNRKSKLQYASSAARE